MSLNDWRPSTDEEAMKARARMLRDIRAFFEARAVLEVETPLLASFGASDPHIGNLSLETHGASRYLQTSPEYAMKRLLANGSGDIYQVTRAFRSGEAGNRHNPEFSILEWYRLDYDHHALMRELEALLGLLLADRLELPTERLSYRQVFIDTLGMDPLECSDRDLRERAQELALLPGGTLDRDGLLDLLMSLAVTPKFPERRLSFVYDWPESQASLARTIPEQPGCAARFEAYCGGLELANGFWELTNADEQARRFTSDNARRRQLGLPEVPADGHLLSALESGLPDCAGVALGLDRVLMLILETDRISDVVNFPWELS